MLCWTVPRTLPSGRQQGALPGWPAAGCRPACYLSAAHMPRSRTVSCTLTMADSKGLPPGGQAAGPAPLHAQVPASPHGPSGSPAAVVLRSISEHAGGGVAARKAGSCIGAAAVNQPGLSVRHRGMSSQAGLAWKGAPGSPLQYEMNAAQGRGHVTPAAPVTRRPLEDHDTPPGPAGAPAVAQCHIQ